MKLILNSDVQSLGRKGDVVDVAKGYARNYLLPKKLAIVATANNLEFAQKLQEKRQEQAQICLLYTSPSPRDPKTSRMPSSA